MGLDTEPPYIATGSLTSKGRQKAPQALAPRFPFMMMEGMQGTIHIASSKAH